MMNMMKSLTLNKTEINIMNKVSPKLIPEKCDTRY